jgi:hypothetical protein
MEVNLTKEQTNQHTKFKYNFLRTEKEGDNGTHEAMIPAYQVTH